MFRTQTFRVQKLASKEIPQQKKEKKINPFLGQINSLRHLREMQSRPRNVTFDSICRDTTYWYDNKILCNFLRTVFYCQ